MPQGKRSHPEVCILNLPLEQYLLYRQRVLTHQIAGIKGAIRSTEDQLAKVQLAKEQIDRVLASER